jgi:hypothetical protein
MINMFFLGGKRGKRNGEKNILPKLCQVSNAQLTTMIKTVKHIKHHPKR